MFDKLEDCLEFGGDESHEEIESIITQLRIRMGSYGIERKNLVNNLFKGILDFTFPNIVKYLFLKCKEDSGIFERVTEEEYNKYRRMSKYKKEQMNAEDPDLVEEEEQINIDSKHINYLLNINAEQNEMMLKQQEKIKVIYENMQGVVDQLMECKMNLFKESKQIEACIENFKNILTPV